MRTPPPRVLRGLVIYVIVRIVLAAQGIRPDVALDMSPLL